MQDLETRATKRYNERRRSTARKYGIGLLALLVLLCTAAALLLPAFTLEKDVFCGLEEHTHTEACYELVPVCVVEEHAAHTHTDACFETARELSCGLEESEGHTHTDACFKEEKALTCVLEEDEGHAHTDACYIEEREPVCGIVETEGHAHDDSCWSTEQDLVCELEENEEHQHDDACYIETSVLVCGEEEREAHTHDESCYVTRLVPNCGEEEREGHTHTDECYTVKQKLVCELPEDAGHTHTDACYTDTQKLICTLPEDEGHTHSEACMEEKLVCEKEEHTHSLQCYSNPEAVESEAAWVLSFPTFGEDATHLERLLGIAESQLGYQESAENYLVDENESLHGYTRFGDFCGEPYADWNAMFVSFCLHYAGIDPAIFPAEGDAQSMIDALTEKELYIPNGTEGFLPRPGDLIFFDNIYTGTYTVRVGIVTSVDRELGVLNVMEGDSADSVAECRYNCDDVTILGYGALPAELREENGVEAEQAEEEYAVEEPPLAEDHEEVASHAEIRAATVSRRKASGMSPLMMMTGGEGEGETGNGEGGTGEGGTEPTITANLVYLVTDSAGKAHISPTHMSYENLMRGEKLHLEFEYTIPNEKLSEAKSSTEWVYDMHDLVGVDKVFSKVDVVESGNLTSGGKTVGTYTIKPDGQFIIKPTKDYRDSMQGDVSGTFSLMVTLNKEFSQDSNDQTITFPGNGTAQFHYEKKEINHSKSVSTTENGGNVSTQGEDKVQLVEEDGKYYLYYTLYIEPQSDLDHLLVSDELDQNQVLEESSLVVYGNNTTYNKEAIASASAFTPPNTNNVFKLDLAKLMTDGVKKNSQYTVKYRTQVKESAVTDLKKGILPALTNEATYTWEGDHAEDKTNVPPKFTEELETSKYVGGNVNAISSIDSPVDVVKDEHGDYYLYYRITAKPNTNLEEIQLEDVVGPGQTGIEIISETANGVDIRSDFHLSINSETNTITGTYQPEDGIKADTEIVVVYRVKLVKNQESDATELSGNKTNTSTWKWKGDDKTNSTDVPPHEPDPYFGISKAAVVVPANPGSTDAKPGDTITYTITIQNPDHLDLSKYPFRDIIANYPFDPPTSITVNGTTVTAGDSLTISSTPPEGTATGASYELFTYTFPSGSTAESYTITYSIKLKDDADNNLALKKALTNKGEIGSGETTTTTTVDYGTPTVQKTWSAWDKANNAVEWKVTVTVPQGESFKNVVLHERDFYGGESVWHQGDKMTIDWSRLLVQELNNDNTAGDTITEGEDTYVKNETDNTITFPTLNKSVVVTLYTNLPKMDTTDNQHLKKDVTFTGLNDDNKEYTVKNTVNITVNGEDGGSSTDTHKYERSNYELTKKGEFDDTEGTERPTATWTVTLNKDMATVDPEVIPYFYDTIPEGMEFYGDTISIAYTSNGHKNKKYDNEIWQGNVTYPYSPRGREIGSINLRDAFMINGTQEQYLPDGLSEVCYTVTYKTRITEAKWKEMQENVGAYSFTNNAKVLDDGGRTLKSTDYTLDYIYKDLVKKVDIGTNSSGGTSGAINTITYRIAVNPDGKTLNAGDKLELFDVLSTRITLRPETVKVYKGRLDSEKNIIGWNDANPAAVQVYPAYKDASENLIPADPKIVVSYNDNTRRLQIFVPDEQAYVVEFAVTPVLDNDKKYENTAVLQAGTLSFESTVSSTYNVDSNATIAANSNDFKLLKLDLYDLNKPVEGAKFKLYKAKLDDNKKIDYAQSELIKASETQDEFVSDENGYVLFNGDTFEENTLYYWEETEAPSGYMLLDESAHYFCIYKEYKHNSEHPLTAQIMMIKKEQLSWAKWSELCGKLNKDTNESEVSIENLKSAFATEGDYNTFLANLAQDLSSTSFKTADKFDENVQDANKIIVLHALNNYTWNWNNPPSTAHSEFKGNKKLYGRDLQEGEFSFTLYEMAGSQEVRVQRVKNKADGNFAFADIAYTEARTYHYQIREDEPADKNKTESEKTVIYDKTPVDVYVEVKPSDLTGGDHKIPPAQISYYKGGVKLDTSVGALFDNDVNKASIIINKVFTGDTVSGMYKDKIVFKVYDKSENGTNTPIATVAYKDMRAGHYTVTEGIQADKEYIVEELLPSDSLGDLICTTTYTVKGEKTMGGTQATVSTAGDKAAQGDFENRYEPNHMQMRVVKKWYVEKDDKDGSGTTIKKNMIPIPADEAPTNVDEVYFKLQRLEPYTGDPSEENYETNKADWAKEESHWKWVDDKFEVESVASTNEASIQDRTYYFTNWFSIRESMNWSRTLGEDGKMPVGQYRVLEIEKTGGVDPDQGEKWKVVSHGNVLYWTGENPPESETVIWYSTPGQVNGMMPDKERFAEDTGIDGSEQPEDGVTYVYNRVYEIEFTKHWYKDQDSFDQDKATWTATGSDGLLIKNRSNASALTALGVKSVTLQLQSSTLKPGHDGSDPNDFEPWQDVAGKSAIVSTTEHKDGKVSFTGIARKDEDGNFLYYRLKETSMVLNDGKDTILNAEQIAERFDLYHEPTPRKDSSGPVYDPGNAYMKPADGLIYDKQDVSNIKKPYGITVTKDWQLTGSEATPKSVYVCIEYNNGNGWGSAYDPSLKTDQGGEPIQYNGMCLYEIRYDEANQKYAPITFSDLFRKEIKYEIGTGTPYYVLSDKAKYNYQEVKAIRFLEYRKVGSNYQVFSDNDHQVKYTFIDKDGNTESAVNGVDPLATGTYKITNIPRSSTQLKVTKAWPDKPETENKIFYQLHMVAEDGTDVILTRNDGNGFNAENSDKHIHFKENSDTIFYLNFTEGNWETATFDLTKQLKFNNNDKNPAGFYVVELNEDGTERKSENSFLVSYGWESDEKDASDNTKPAETRDGVGKDKLAPSSTNGTITITNSRPSGPKATKSWQSASGETVDWPDAVRNVKLQLLRRQKGSTDNLDAVGTVKTITAANPVAKWDDVTPDDSYDYFVREVSVTYMENGTVYTDEGGDKLRKWFVKTSDIAGDYAVKLEGGTAQLTGEVVNTAPPEETTSLSMTKRWTEKDGSTPIKATQGDYITLRLFSCTASDPTPVQVDLSKVVLEKLELSGSDALKLTADESGWPTGRVLNLPRYRGGEPVRYFVRELSAVHDNAPQNFHTGYNLPGGEESEDPQKAATEGGLTNIINVHNQPTDRHISVKKLWDDSYVHTEETAVMQLYRWTDNDSNFAPVIDQNPSVIGGDPDNTMTLNIELDTSTLPDSDWEIKFEDLKDENSGILVVRNHSISYSNSDKTSKQYILPVKNGDTPIQYSCLYSGHYDSNYVCRMYLEGSTREPWVLGNNADKDQFAMPAIAGEQTITIKFERLDTTPSGNSMPGLRLSDAAVFDAGGSQPALKTIHVSDLPAGAEPFRDPVVLNRDGIGLSYTWENLPETDGAGKKYHYAVAELYVGYTLASENEVSYTYVYGDSPDQKDTLDNTRDVQEVIVTNKPTYPSWNNAMLKIIKLDSDDLNTELAKVRGLAGAHFKLEKKTGEEAYVIVNGLEDIVTDKNGELVVTNLGAGEYRLTETQAPAGYVMSGEPFAFTFDNQGKLSYTRSRLIQAETNDTDKLTGIFRIGNEKGVELPSTGGMGVGAYRIGGAALLLAATGLAAAESLKRSRADRARRRKGGEGET